MWRALLITIVTAGLWAGCTESGNSTSPQTPTPRSQVSGGLSTDEYLRQIGPLAEQYNSARDVVERSLRASDSATTLQEGAEADRRAISDLGQAVVEMNNAYLAFGNREFPEKFHQHQEATLLAWRAGIEATTTVKLGLETAVAAGQPLGLVDPSIIIAANRLFGEEDSHQFSARRALQALR